MRLLDLKFPSPNEMRVVFGFSYPRAPQVALIITVDTREGDREKLFTEVMKIIEVVRYCHNYENCPECSWRQLMTIVSRCRACVPVTFGATAVTVRIRDRVIDDLAKAEVFLRKSLSTVEL